MMTYSRLWPLSSVVIAGLLVLPLAALVFLGLGADLDLWGHLADTVLADYVLNSLLLGGGVAGLTSVLGVGSALLVTQYRFPGSNSLQWALLLPLAMPAYITAYAYTGLLDVSGPVQSSFRLWTGLGVGEYWFPQIRSLPGAIWVLSFALYPYVFLLSRTAFLEQSNNLRDAALLLGYGRRSILFKITIAVARPAIIAGVALALMETLADFGAVSYFGVNTFTTGIYRTWTSLDSIGNAALLSLCLLVFVFLLLRMERQSRQRAAYGDKIVNPVQPRILTGWKKLFVLLCASLPLLLGFIVPMIQLGTWAIDNSHELFTSRYWHLLINTFSVAAIAALFAVGLALIVAYAHRLSDSRITAASKQLLGLGYAVPGLVIALGVLIPIAYLDSQLNKFSEYWFGSSTGLLISGSIAILILAYLVRFLAVALATVDSSLENIGRNLDQAARSMGRSSGQTLRQIHLPLMRGSVLTALILVFVDVMKELPATLVLRPFNFNTFAVRAYELASDERLADAALPALSIVAVGLIPVVILSRLVRQR